MSVLAHALDCADAIIEFTANGLDGFLNDRKTRDAVIRNLEVIGQCVRDSDIASLEASSPEIPWRKIAGFRNVLAHDYLGVDPLLVWKIIETQLPTLRQALTEILKSPHP